MATGVGPSEVEWPDGVDLPKLQELFREGSPEFREAFDPIDFHMMGEIGNSCQSLRADVYNALCWPAYPIDGQNQLVFTPGNIVPIAYNDFGTPNKVKKGTGYSIGTNMRIY